ncbi:MAG: hypothetical protein POG74_05295 [Acidocella sp.]|nr:hypothetical protein [Acidocella sp.]
MCCKPGITAPTVGATKRAHLDNAIAAAKLTLTANEMARLEAPCVPHAIVGFS